MSGKFCCPTVDNQMFILQYNALHCNLCDLKYIFIFTDIHETLDIGKFDTYWKFKNIQKKFSIYMHKIR